MNLNGSAKLHTILSATFLVVLACALASFSAVKTASARPHIVVDAETGKVLAHHRAHRRWAPASLTKLMTTYVTFRAIKLQQITLNSPVTISARASRLPPSKMGFPPGTVLTIDQAIKIIMVKSANDVALAIGESVAGSESAFVDLMNAHARRLGMVNTRFKNPHGLPNKGQYTTAVDMAKLGIAMQKEFPEYKKYLNVPGIVYKRRRMRNFNRLLTRFSGTTGMKTGYICASGYNVIVSAERRIADGAKRKLIAVVMGQTSGRRRNAKAAELLYKGFRKGRNHGQVILADFEPKTAINPVPADITEETCRRKKRARKKASVANLKNLEARYMSKPFSVGAYHTITLGGATGPNPHAARFKGSRAKTAAIPIPMKRPPLICPQFAAASDGPDAPSDLVSLAVKNAADEKIENPAASANNGKTGEARYPMPKGCLPVPLARKDAPEATVVLASAGTETVLEAATGDQSSPQAPPAVSDTAAKPVVETDSEPVAQAFARFDLKSPPIPTRRSEPSLLSSFVASANAQTPEPEVEKTDSVQPAAQSVTPPADTLTAETQQPAEIKLAAVDPGIEEGSQQADLPIQPPVQPTVEKPAEETETATLQPDPNATEIPSPEVPVDSLDGEVTEDATDAAEEVDLASLPPEYLVIPEKRPPYKPKTAKKRKPKAESPKPAEVAETPSEKDAKKAKKPAHNPFANNVCRMYRNSGCFPELLKTKKTSKKQTAGAKKLPAHCPALQSLYRQNRKSGLDCKSG